jgi:hypothetical protein
MPLINSSRIISQKKSAGILIPNAESVTREVPWGKAPDKAMVTFLDDKTRKPYKIPVSLADVNAKVSSGECKRVTIRILDYEKADVSCK